ncbi:MULTISPECIES: KGK domain-containing protein [unclassified Nostoc]|uniref:KGK domain-containing protein n=1 Tax=unclassified Nostoc TaxID=2593658 RepID=UPI002AD1F227|nr:MULTISPECIES: KGK domain-containing protein [unclassified Nostoc]MDZ8034881.1 KGK domain-containing protein [Nostoc sp. DedSLP04]MDZ8135117.1 KGK domain-containing protein [Nostoc sp. DedQUE04]
MSDQIILSDEDVVSMAQDANLTGASTSTGEELMQRLKYLVHRNSNLQADKASDWFEDGANCKLLLAQGGGWQKGKIRILFEFVSENPKPTKPLISTNSASPLDDLRSHLEV